MVVVADNRQRRKGGPPGPGGGGGGGRVGGGGVATSTSAASSSTAYHHHDDRMLRVIKVEEIDVEEDYGDPVYPVEDDEDEDEDEDEEPDDEPKLMVTSSISSTARQQPQRVLNPQHQRQPLRRSQPQQRRDLIECPLCIRSYYDIGDMRAHLDHHYPRDSPTCPVVSCGKNFSHPNSVRNHMRVKHADQWDKIKTLRWTYV